MALTDAELQRIRFELGVPNFDLAAEPYIGVAAFFSQVMQPFLLSGAATTSTTVLDTLVAPVPVTLTLASAAGFAVGNVVVVDVDLRQERATVSAVSGNTITLQLARAHGPSPYPVTVEGAESIVRDILAQLRDVADSIKSVRSRVGLRKVDDVEFYGGGRTLASQGIDPLTALFELRERWRDELSSAVGFARVNGRNASGGGSDFVVY